MKNILPFLLSFLLLGGLTACTRSVSENKPQTYTDSHHHTAAQAQTDTDPTVIDCGNTLTTLYIGDKQYTFMGGCSVTLTDILTNLDYDPDKMCKCLPEYTVDTEYGKGYGISLNGNEGYARCGNAQADLTQEQVQKISEIISTVQRDDFDDLLEKK